MVSRKSVSGPRKQAGQSGMRGAARSGKRAVRFGKRAAQSGRSVSRLRLVRAQVAETVLHLGSIQSAVVVAVAALRHQNCELDEDIASVLQRGVADRIQDQIDRLELVLRLLTEMERRPVR